MIILDLVCDAGHRFEGWFASIDAFEQQMRSRLVICPHCDSHRIERLPAAPKIVRAESRKDQGRPPAESSSIQALLDKLDELAADAEDVGRRFPEEARRIHYDETERRSIRGLATLEETRELLEEGIPVLPLSKKRTSH